MDGAWSEASKTQCEWEMQNEVIRRNREKNTM